MCGIVAYLGAEQAASDVLVKGLQRLEYRGYDSAGVGVVDAEGKLTIVKRVGKVANLESALKGSLATGSLGVGHTRWATHGEPSDVNSHPHATMSGDLCVVHNGIVENYEVLRTVLRKKGYSFSSETDTEVLAHLIDDVRKTHRRRAGKTVSIYTDSSSSTDDEEAAKEQRPEEAEPGDEPIALEEAVRLALTQVEGTFGLAVVSEAEPNKLVGARMGSPLVVGLGKDGSEYFLASDASAVIEHTADVLFLKDGDMITVTQQPAEGGEGEQAIRYTHRVVSLASDDGTTLTRHIQQLSMKREEIEKGGFKFFMMKEIFDQPRTLAECMRGRVMLGDGLATPPYIKLGGLSGDPWSKLMSARRIIICACGTSWHAGMVGEYLLEQFARVNVKVEYASEFRYKNPVLDGESDIVLVISQSGETADTLAAVRQAKENGVMAIGVVNTVGSTIARETDAGMYLHAGYEVGVASTKAFTAQVTCLAMIALKLGHDKGQVNDEAFAHNIRALAAIPEQVQVVLSSITEQIRDAAKTFRLARHFLYLGRGFNLPVALEGALKLKEISYIHAEGYPAAELKHGPIALIDPLMPVLFIAPQSDKTYSKIKANIEEVLARKGSIIVITEEGNDDFAGREGVEYVFHVPRTEEWLSPLLNVVPLQILSYFVADMLGLDVDKPRNLAKSVTVE